MSMILTAEQVARLTVYVERGDFATVEEAASHLIDERLAELALDEIDDMAWSKPLVDEALAQEAQGKFITREEHEARMTARLAAMKD
jgi:antitoxin ParD1/3/4